MTESDDKVAEEKIKETASIELLKKINAAANYCYSCNKCVNVCPKSELDVFYPRKLISDLCFMSIEEALDNNIWECLTCGQCSTYCPMTTEKIGVRIPELILELRKGFNASETEQEKLFQCETHDEIFPLISKIMSQKTLHPDKLDFLEGAELKVTDSGEIAYFVGCLPLMEDIIYDSDIKFTNTNKSIIGMLNESNIIPVVLNEKCCGHDILWGKGDTATFKMLAEYNVKLYREAGVKTIIVGCAEGYRTWKFDYPNVIDDFNFDVLHFSEFFLKENVLDDLRFPQQEKVKVTYHDSCRLGRLGGKVYDAPRQLIKLIPGVELIEMENIKDDANCCGVTAFMNCNENSRILRKNRINEAIKTGANYLIVPCPKCLTHFNCYLDEPALNEGDDKLRDKIKVIDLANFIGKRLLIV